MRIYKLPERRPDERPCPEKITDPVTGDVVTCALWWDHDDDCGRGFLRWDPEHPDGLWYSCREYRSAAEIRERMNRWEDDLLWRDGIRPIFPY